MRAPGLVAAALLALTLLLLPSAAAGGDECDGGYPGQTEWIKALLIVEPGIEQTYTFKPSEVLVILKLLNPGPFPNVINVDTVLVFHGDRQRYEYVAGFRHACIVFTFRKQEGWHQKFLLPEIGV
jgi:hypothetical protein